MRGSKSLLFIGGLVLLAHAALPPAQEVKEFLSDEIFALAGRGDTLWMLSSKGFNYTLANSDSLLWQGLKYNRADSLFNKAIAFGEGRFVAALTGDNYSIANGLWVYDYRTGSGTEKQLPWNLRLPDDIKGKTSLYIYDVDWQPGCFWLACWHGGVVRWDPTANGGTVFYPGHDTAYSLNGFPPQDLAGFPDSNLKVYAIAPSRDSSGDPLIYAVTPKRIFALHCADSSWDTLPTAVNGRGEASEFENVYKRSDGTGPLYAYLAVHDTLLLCSFDPASRVWKTFLEVNKDTLCLAFGSGDTMYVGYDKDIWAYRQNSGSLVIRQDEFDARRPTAHQQINDMLFVPHDTGVDANFWIATPNGLYYSRQERHDEENSVLLNLVKRMTPIQNGLKQTYLFPSILNGYYSKGIFAYNLSKDANVTITVYDWNMDFVKTIIRNQPRQAGINRKEKRSTIPDEDWWDGTTQQGKPVAPGIYYYKITTTKGERAFGKIVVAK
jgi:hypothetical protein